MKVLSLLVWLLLSVCTGLTLADEPPPTATQSPAIPQHLKRDPAIPEDVERTAGPKEIGDVLAVSGKTHPELIPDYRAWQHVLTKIAVAKADAQHFEWPHIREEPHLAPADEALLLKSADLETTQAQQDSERINKRIEELKAQHPGQTVSVFDLTLASRQRTLELVDGLMEKLSPEGQTSLLQYKNGIVASMTVYVPLGAWETYRLPR